MRYSVQIKKSALKEIQSLPKAERIRVIESIDRLVDTPHIGKALKGDLSGLRRIRAGNYRVVYEINDNQLVILVLRAAHRKDSYRK
ncbi:type II toxin-antitoxin system mRNA interferase toxin, RelE/StbE family [Pelovirga terrestris]|uniref:Type II toxin-antitoxin system RelE/ParE family toxin n=1 Tax=Pelovirga terrestris TaxID=2771352 RepID=A0A8J6UKL6_9BACT|nr:type II toxin-antitoxin system RelE/ParE family toxin [Pelovirga terrestris]